MNVTSVVSEARGLTGIIKSLEEIEASVLLGMITRVVR